MSTILKVISRESPLALKQVEEIAGLFPEVKFDVLTVSSFGDRHKGQSLMDDAVPADFFTRELDAAVLDGSADIAVHSAKDLPYPLPAGLEVYCLTAASDKSDSLATRSGVGLAQLPRGSRVGTSSKMRRDELLALRPDLEIVPVRGTIEERLAQVDDGRLDALVVATCALTRLGLEHRIAERLPFQTHPLQGNLAVVGRAERPELRAVFERHDIRRTHGRVTLVGFGPGDGELLTLAGDKALRSADVIFHDDLIDHEFLSRYSAETVYVGKRSGRHSHSQTDINRLLYEAAIAGRNVVRLKGGDPMIFAHGREEIDFLQSRMVSVSVIPGISSGIALAALTHIPLTHRGLASSVAFVSGHGEHIATPSADTLVYFMGGNNIAGVARALLASGRASDTPAALVYNVSMPDQKTFFSTIGELSRSVVRRPTPILIVVGEVVALESGHAPRPRVLATGTTAPPLAAATHTPLIKISPKTDVPTSAIARRYDWIIFTSRHGVRFYFDLLSKAKIDIRNLATTKIASVGPVTSNELKQRCVTPDFESPTESAEGLIAFFREIDLSGKSILLPRSDKGLPALSDALRTMGADVVDLPVYTNEINGEASKIDLSLFDQILFSSPSGVEAFRQIYRDFPEKICLTAKGETTQKALICNVLETSEQLKK